MLLTLNLLDSLHCRRTKADLTMCYKIITNHVFRLLPFLPFRLSIKPGVIPENSTNRTSLLCVMAILLSNALLSGTLFLTVS